jgi:hypothetical protein
VTGTETYVLAGFVAGFRWRPARPGLATDLPPAVPTVSDCLADFLPADQDIEPWQQPLFEPWHRAFDTRPTPSGTRRRTPAPLTC